MYKKDIHTVKQYEASYTNKMKNMEVEEMTNLEKYKKAFETGLELSEEMITPELEYQKVESWDSVGHMSLIAELEDAFGIMMDTDDIIDLSSYTKGMDILKKYGVEF